MKRVESSRSSRIRAFLSLKEESSDVMEEAPFYRPIAAQMANTEQDSTPSA